MANKEELKNMVLQFKVSDLQLLLGFAGQNKNGRKSELQKKALKLIYHKMSIPLELKIRQMYRDIIPDNSSPKPTNGYYTANGYPDKYNNYYTNGHSRQSAQSSPYDGFNPMTYYPNHPLDNYYDNYWSPSLNYPNYGPSGHEGQSSKLNSSHPGSFNIKMPTNQNLSNITFKKLPFYQYKSDILSVTPLNPKKQRGDSFEFSHSFLLNQQQLSRLEWNKKNDENRYQVQLRICAINEATEVSDDLPLALTVKVNDKSCQLPPAIPSTNKQGMLLKRMNAPINVTSQTSRKNNPNSLLISWSIACDKLYGVGIYLVKKFTADELINKLKEKGERDPEITKKYLSDKLGQLEDDDIAATSLKVSMICPLGKIIMSLPVRASTCNHLQCFDGALYIKMNDVKSTWQCPVCNQSCLYEDLFIDGYFVNVLKNNYFSPNASEIQIEADGSVTPVVQNKRSNTSTTPTNPCKKMKFDEEEPSLHEKEEPSLSENSSPAPNEKNFSTADITTTTISNESLVPSPSDYDESSSSVTALDLSAENQAKKEVELVDLTESDSEPDDQQNMPLNLKKYADTAECALEPCSSNNAMNSNEKQSPPVYDIE